MRTFSSFSFGLNLFTTEVISSCSDGIASSSKRSLLILLSLALEYACDTERSSVEVARPLDPVRDTSPLSPPLPRPELPSRGFPTLTPLSHTSRGGGMFCTERAPAKGPRLMVPRLLPPFALGFIVGMSIGLVRWDGFSGRMVSAVPFRRTDSRGAGR